jgi:16S rRNA (guanine966-N2)-methyltransferase
MRIISGIAAGIRLDVPPGTSVRPTTDRIRESLFSMIGDVADLRVADLFAGSGALGLEALSRGAAEAVFVDTHPKHRRVLQSNLERVLHCIEVNGHPCPRTRVAGADAWHPDRALPSGFDILFADPPYSRATTPDGLPAWLTDPAIAEWAGNALLVLESPAGAPLPWHPSGPWVHARQKRYGDTMIAFCRVASPS